VAVPWQGKPSKALVACPQVRFSLYAGITMSASSLIPTTEPRFQVPDARGRFGQFGGM